MSHSFYSGISPGVIVRNYIRAVGHLNEQALYDDYDGWICDISYIMVHNGGYQRADSLLSDNVTLI